MQDLAAGTGAGVAAADHSVGSLLEGGSWQLDVRVAGARGQVPFSAAALGAFREILGTWSAASSMANARHAAAAVLLGSGKVLVAGGGNDSAFTASAELYDPASDAWSAAASMAAARAGATATLLSNGQVLVAGGEGNTNNFLASAELYDPVSNIWTSAGSMATARANHTAMLLGNGQVLVIGGTNGGSDYLASAELYDPVANTWSAAASMGAVRAGATPTLLNNGQVLIMGGRNSGGYLSSAELYDPVSNIWTAEASMATVRWQNSATLLSNGLVLVAGGFNGVSHYLASAEVYDPVANTWSAAGPMAKARGYQTATLLGNGQVLVTGGSDGNNILSSAELYDPVSNTWSAAPAMATVRWLDTATLLGNGQVLAAGGDDGITSLSSAELYNPGGSINLTQSAIAISSTPNPSIYGQSVSFTATVTVGTSPVTTGTVTFEEGSTVLAANVAVDRNSHAGFSIANLSATASPHVITALYSGTSQLAPSTGTTSQTVKPLAVTVSADSKSKPYGSADPALSYQITVGALLSGDAFAGALMRVSGENAGSYAIQQGTLATSGNYAITYVSANLTIVPGKFAVNVWGTNPVIAGNSFLFTAQGLDSSGNPVTSYSGSTGVTASITPNDPQGSFPLPGMLNSIGTGYFLGNIKTAGSYTIAATGGAFNGTSSTINVVPAAAAYFTITAAPTAITGTSFNITVKAYDPFHNLATGYNGKVHLSSSDAKATLPADATLAGGIGTLPVTLNTAGGQTITATDGVSFSPITIFGSSDAIAVSGLEVTALTKRPTGFTATFNQAINPADLTIYGGGNTQQDVLLVGISTNNGQPYPGTVIVDASKKLITFNVSSNYLVASNPGGSATLPDDTYTVTLVSGVGANGFEDLIGQGIDNGHVGHADFVGGFSTTYQHDNTEVLGIPDFARTQCIRRHQHAR